MLAYYIILKITLKVNQTYTYEPRYSTNSRFFSILDGSLDEKEMQGRFSGASSPWYKMMMSSNDEDDHLETNQSARKKKFVPKIKVQDKGTYIKTYS